MKAPWLQRLIAVGRRRPLAAFTCIAVVAVLVGFGAAKGFIAFAPLVVEGIAHSAVRRSIEGAVEAAVETGAKDIAKGV